MSDLIPTNASTLDQGGSQLDYEDALRSVMSLADFERSTYSPAHSSFHLERMELLMDELGNPHLEVPAVHIAGTKGKGSTAAMVTSVLAAGGYKVGLFTSPHIHSAVERIRVGLQPIGGNEFANLVKQVWPAVEYASKEGSYGAITTFEMFAAMAFVHFREIGADFQVIEVGLGGRLDATNIVSPEVCVITSISLDHVATLGNTVERIAFEKAGIMKNGVPVVLAAQSSEVLSVLRKAASAKKAPVIEVNGQISYRKGQGDLYGQSFEVDGLRNIYELWMPLLGDHQLENAGAAVAAVETLISKGVHLSKENVIQGIGEVRWPSRMEVLLWDGPVLLVDGAHNPYSVKCLVQAVRDYFQFRKLYLLFGALIGHSIKGMISELVDLSPVVLAVSSRHPRSESSSIVSHEVLRSGLSVVYQSENVGEGTRRALEMAGPRDLVLCTGSLSVAAEATEEIKGIKAERYPYIKSPGCKTGT